jgi:S-adenosylmethionine decarboxylase
MAKRFVAGYHILIDFLVENIDCIANKSLAEKKLEEIIEESGLSKLGKFVYKFEQGKAGEPGGITCCYPLKESHLTLHTWPEEKYGAADIFTCANEKPIDEAIQKAEKALELFIEKFGVVEYKVKRYKRGI